MHRCCLDIVPRQLTAADCCVLTNIAELVVRQLEKDHLLHLKRQVTSAQGTRAGLLPALICPCLLKLVCVRHPGHQKLKVWG